MLPDGREGGFGMAGELPKEMTLLQCAEYVKDVFQIPDVKIFGNPETVLNRAAVLPGSGKSMTADALRNGAEVYITGDFGHHDGIDAVDQGLNVIDAGHNTMFRLEMPRNGNLYRADPTSVFDGVDKFSENFKSQNGIFRYR